MGFEATMLKSMVRVATPGDDLLDDLLGDLLDDLLPLCAGALGTIAFTMYKIGD